MDTAKKIRASFKKLYMGIKSAKDISEEDLRVAFVKSGILEVLGYEGELKDVQFEKGVRGKRSDLLAFDDYQNVVFVVEFKRPTEIDVERDFAQLWERYVKPLRARYGVLTDGLELLLYEREYGKPERKLRVNLSEVTLPQCEEIYDWLKKPEIKRTRIAEVLGYFERFDNPEEKVNLSSEIAQKHFFDSFELKGDSIFVNLVQKTIGLFDLELERSKFLKSAYNFWKVSYAKKPEKVPENWKRIMDKIELETNEENLFKFMFCLESAYSLFTRLILAKACEDFKLPYIDFSDFIKREIERTSHRGDISSLAWPITTKNLIENMKENLVKSVFEGDIFYWWEDSYKELRAGDSLYSPYHRYEKQKAYFGDALADIILTLYKFDFSEIVGDPLGTLYQRYFDKETRKALGEFYTPQEVVEYILDAVGYEGRGVIGKKLLDPACGSGTFLVEALRRYLKASEQLVEEKGWSGILKELCNEYCIAGFDIHPFATFMAQMQFMLVLIPAYKKAIEEEDPKFVLNRLPIFRTDSLVDETKGKAIKVTIESFESGIRYILIDTCLPVEGGNLKIKMPYFKDVIAKTDLPNVEEYFAALQAVFDTVKESARQEKYEVDKEELERNFKRYLEDREWNGLVSFFTPYAEHFLQKFKELKATFGDGKLIKSIEDIMLAAILKNYVKYDFVVGNPPYVSERIISPSYKSLLGHLYPDFFRGKADLYVYFIGRGINWLSERGILGFITSNKFAQSKYGDGIRLFISRNCRIDQFVDFGDSRVFADVTNYPSIIIFQRAKNENNFIKCVRVISPHEFLLNEIRTHIDGKFYIRPFFEIFKIRQAELTSENWLLIPSSESNILDKIKSVKTVLLTDISSIHEGIHGTPNEVYYDDMTQDKKIKRYKIESELCKPCLNGKDVRRWKINWANQYLLYPHKKIEDKVSPINLEQYPNAKTYLEGYKQKLLEREYLIKAGQQWFELWNYRDPDYFKNPKIITPDTSNNNNFVYDENKFYCLRTCYVILPISKEKTQHLYLLGLLNSDILTFFIKHISPFVSGKYYNYKKNYLERLPIRLPQTPSEQNLADEITNKVEQILEKVKIEQQIENFPGEYIQNYRSKGKEFDSINISFNSNHKTIEPVIEKDTSGRGYNIAIGKKEKPVFVESEVKANYVVATLKGKNAKKDKKKQILIPKSDAIVEEILRKLEEDNARIKSPSVAELEEEINELVYKLYGLNEKDVKVIDDFLRKF